MYSSPGTPSGASRPASSSTCRSVFAIGVEPGDRRPDRRLGRSVHVPQRHARGQQPLREILGQRLTAHEHPQAGAAGPAGVQQHPPGGRRRLHHGRRGSGEQVAQPLPVRGDLPAGQHDPGPNDQGQQQFEHRDVERQRGDGQQRVGGLDAGPLLHRVQEVAQRAVRDLHALRPSGRAGGVDDVGQVGRVHRHAGRRTRLRRQLLADLVQAPDGGLDAAQPVVQPLQDRPLRQQYRQPRVGHHEGDPVGREARVQRYVGAAGLQHAQHRRQHLWRPVQADAHQHVRPDAGTPQPVRQLVGLPVQFAVPQDGVHVAHRLGPRRPRRLPREAFVREQRLGPAPVGVVPLQAQAALLVGAEHRYLGDRPVRVGEQVAHQQRQVPGQSRDGGRVEQVAVVREPAGDGLRPVEHLQFQVEAGGGAGHVERLQLQAGHVELR